MIDAGKVYLVGAGPGDPGLITLRARELIGACDVLVYDYLTNPLIRSWAKPGCELLYVGKRPNLHAIPQEEIEALLVDRARQGKSVVRLKGGDPFVFGRGGEEALRLKEAGLSFEIVPAVTAALGTAAYAGIPLTYREQSSSISFITGHEDPEKKQVQVDFRQYAKLGGTLCIYMGMGHLDHIVSELIAGGLSEKTPVAVVQWATLPRQRSVSGTLKDIKAKVEAAGLSSPAVIVVGKVVGLAGDLGWFQHQPLFGRRIVVTRSRDQAGELSRRLLALGAEVLELPLISVSETMAPDRENEVWGELGSYEWIVFTSPNGARFFFEKFFRRFSDIRYFGGLKIACIGASTASEVEKYRLTVDHIPEVSVAESLAESLLQRESLEHQKILLVTGNRNREVLAEKLEEALAIVDTFPVYETTLTDLSEDPVASGFREEGADVITFTSSSTVENFVAQAAHLALAPGARRPQTVSIGPITSQAMKEKKLPINREADEASMDSMVAAICELLGAK